MIVHQEVDRLTRDFDWNSHLRGPNTDGMYAVSKSAVPSSYSLDQMEELDEGEGGWWYETRNRVVESSLKRYPIDGVLWDIGSGSGLVTRHLHSVGQKALGLEPTLRGAQLAAQRDVPSIQGSLQDLQLPTNSIQAIGMFDVLEHLDDREGMLREVYRVLMSDGRLFLTLPALKLLWSQFDIDNGHYLRYTKKTITQELKRVGFEVQNLRYFFLCSLPVLLLVRALPYRIGRKPLISNRQMLRGEAGLLGKLATSFELVWSRVGLIGTSLMVVARKP